jgi:hypothetical protein
MTTHRSPSARVALGRAHGQLTFCEHASSASKSFAPFGQFFLHVAKHGWPGAQFIPSMHK